MSAVPYCPYCNNELRVLLFMGVQPDGYICDTCRLWLDNTDLHPLATVIMAKKEEEHEDHSSQV